MKSLAEWIFAIAIVLLVRQVWVIFWPVVKVAAHRFFKRAR
jgi:hypothetical protein